VSDIKASKTGARAPVLTVRTKEWRGAWWSIPLPKMPNCER